MVMRMRKMTRRRRRMTRRRRRMTRRRWEMTRRMMMRRRRRMMRRLGHSNATSLVPRPFTPSVYNHLHTAIGGGKYKA